MKFGPLYILLVTAGNTTEGKIWDMINVIGMFDQQKYGDHSLTCCLKFTIANNKTLVKSVVPLVNRKKLFQRNTHMRSLYLACPNTNAPKIPSGVAVTTSELCDERYVTYVPLYLPLKQPKGKLVICTKAAFDNINPELIIEWMEAYKYLGVDKVISYYLESINSDALKVLEYYAATGILELIFHQPANEGT